MSSLPHGGDVNQYWTESKIFRSVEAKRSVWQISHQLCRRLIRSRIIAATFHSDIFFFFFFWKKKRKKKKKKKKSLAWFHRSFQQNFAFLKQWKSACAVRQTRRKLKHFSQGSGYDWKMWWKSKPLDVVQREWFRKSNLKMLRVPLCLTAISSQNLYHQAHWLLLYRFSFSFFFLGTCQMKNKPWCGHGHGRQQHMSFSWQIPAMSAEQSTSLPYPEQSLVRPM